MRRFYSQRLPWHLEPNRLSRLREGVRGYLDLTISNPTQAGIEYPPLLDALADTRSLRYEPTAFGLRGAREAVSAYYARRGYAVDPDSILLTASTSEAYSFLFKLLGDAGDEVLVPRPSYPLFEFLAQLDCLEVRQYTLHYDGRWFADQLPLTRRTCAVVNVYPNNPTGSATMIDLQDVPLIVDEVFADYLLTPATRLIGDFTLNGLSKLAGLPQMKLGWIVFPARYREPLELIADTYLSVSAPIQYATTRWLELADGIQKQILDRVQANYTWIRGRLAGTALTPLNIDGGWTIPIEVPKTRGEEDWACDFLERHRVLVQPGYFYDFPREAFLIVSLLTPSDIFQEGIDRIATAVC